MTTKRNIIQTCLLCAGMLPILFATSTCAADGTPVWTNVFNRAGNSDEQPRSLALDGSGNVYVTGHSYVAASGDDYATIKYSSAGVPLWTNLFNNSARNGNDNAESLAVDGSGNVYVTGHSAGASGDDYATIKYSSAGVPLWTNLFNGAANSVDQARSVELDGSGNVYVTGHSAGTINYDYVTIKYSSAGAPVWTNLFNSAGNSPYEALSLAVDGSGNVYVAGYSIGSVSYDYATIKYSSAGVPLWTNLFHGAGNNEDKAQSLAVDGSGNVYVTGFSFRSVSGYDYATIKYSSAGAPVWTNLFNGAGNKADQAKSLAVDGSGNVYVTGYSDVFLSSYDYATIKYSTAGVPLWTNLFAGTGNYIHETIALAVDGSGNVYVTGFSYGGVSSDDYATIKYSSAGVPLWTNLFNGSGNGNDFAQSLAVDGSGNVYVTGYSDGGASSYNYATIKYSGGAGNSPGYNQITGTPLNGGGMRLSYLGIAGTNYALERTLKLTPPVWIPQLTNPASAGGVIVFTNTPVATTNNYWRIRSVP